MLICVYRQRGVCVYNKCVFLHAVKTLGQCGGGGLGCGRFAENPVHSELCNSLRSSLLDVAQAPCLANFLKTVFCFFYLASHSYFVGEKTALKVFEFQTTFSQFLHSS